MKLKQYLGQEGLDVQKKTDGSVNIIGEVATDPVAAWMIQAAQVASKFTLFTHHAKTFPDLVTALRNSMLRTGVFKNEKTAEEQVIQVLNFDIHLVKDFRGRRYIERVTECIPIENKNEYNFEHRKEKTLEGKFDKFFDNATVFFSKTTNSELYTYRNILEFVDDRYVLTNPISPENIRGMRENMNEEDQLAFDAFLERNWGIKPPKMIKYDENGDEIKSEPIKRIESSKVNQTQKIHENLGNKLNLEVPKAVEANVTLENNNEILKNNEIPKNINGIPKENLNKNLEEEKTKRRVIKSLGLNKSSKEPEIEVPKTENEIRNTILDGLGFENEEDDEDNEN